MAADAQFTGRPGASRAAWSAVHCAVATRGGAGYTAHRFQELSEFAGPGENIDERFNGFHIMGGVEYLPLRWLAIGGEVAWTSVPDAIGTSGRSAFFNETNLGGTTLRVKLTLGQ